jgi:hypothetical protein
MNFYDPFKKSWPGLSQKIIQYEIPINFCKVVPADNNRLYLVGGGVN